MINKFWKLLMISGPCFLAAWIVLLFWLVPIYSSIDPQFATREKLVNWFLLRDFRCVPEKTHAALAECYIKEFGTPSQKKPNFEFSWLFKYQAKKIELARRVRVQQEIKVLKEPEKLLTIRMPMQECNAKLLIKAWLIEQAAKWDQASFTEKKVIMAQIVKEVKWWQDYNAIYLVACDVTPSSPIESMQDLDALFARWEAESEPELAERLRKLKTQLVAGMVNDGINEAFGSKINGFLNGFGK